MVDERMMMISLYSMRHHRQESQALRGRTPDMALEATDIWARTAATGNARDSDILNIQNVNQGKKMTLGSAHQFMHHANGTDCQ